MRPRIAVGLIFLSLLVVASLFVLRQSLRSSSQRERAQDAIPAPGLTNQAVAQALPAAQRSVTPDPKQVQEHPVGTTSELPVDQPKGYVESRVEQLMDLAMDNDPASLDAILSELGNRDPQIRKAAREAAVQFGSRDAIPKLIEASTQTDDPAEKAELLEAADFLKLPSLSETLAQAGKAGSAVTKTPQAKPAPRAKPW